ncbi:MULTISPECIES: SIR2 family protein [Microbacterium]|uniref:SIR2 family protein n=1 Tax=Microbacterium TaxID=33882 RepID=UPI0012FE9FD3|nr:MULTISPECIES: SIR2 family protein [Microbacterium]
MSLISSRRPIYVLGAGFSKAVNNAMPITNELGISLSERLAGKVDFDLRPGETFESWLTLQVTPLPFLQGFENAQRSANASRIIDEIARVIDERVHTASAESAPLWLLQLIAIWHMEQAVVLTFNYDTLVERAVNSSAPTMTTPEGQVSYVLGDHIVFPAPPAPQAQYIGDSGAGHTDGSFELLKMHGSLTWYWASGDPTGSTLVRIREKHALGTNTPLATETDFSGIATLDRYLIPPITTKDVYYGSYLANTLWRMARSHISTAESVTLIGYSLPPEDRVASHLIAQVPEDASVAVVDRSPGYPEAPGSVLGNLSALGVSATSAAAGDQSLAVFVSEKIDAATGALPNSPGFDELENANADVIVALSKGWGVRDMSDLFVLAWNEGRQVFEAHEVKYGYLHGATMPYRESVLNAMPSGHRKLDDFVTASKLRELIRDGAPFVFEDPLNKRKLIAIGAERLKIERWENLQLKWAPYSQ